MTIEETGEFEPPEEGMIEDTSPAEEIVEEMTPEETPESTPEKEIPEESSEEKPAEPVNEIDLAK